MESDSLPPLKYRKSVQSVDVFSGNNYKAPTPPEPINNNLFLWHLIVLFSFPGSWMVYKTSILSISLVLLSECALVCLSLLNYKRLWTNYYQKLYEEKYETAKDIKAENAVQNLVNGSILNRILEFIITWGWGIFISIGIYFQSTNTYQLGLFMISLAIYHFLEYSFCLLFHFEKLHPDSFLINQSKEYGMAMAIAFTEYLLEYFLFPEMKLSKYWIVITALGAILTFTGHLLRAGAEFTAKSNFTHQISFSKKSSHKLVTHGVYSISRHPGYLGWFIWSVSTQIMMWNPISAIGFVLASYHFFKGRIDIEEEMLIDFFGEEYIKYMQRVPTRIPFIE